jgi:hypothetical protein
MAVRSEQTPAGGISRSDIFLAFVVAFILLGLTALSVYCNYFCFTHGTISYWTYLGIR